MQCFSSLAGWSKKPHYCNKLVLFAWQGYNFKEGGCAGAAGLTEKICSDTLGYIMAKEKSSWDDIPSLDGLGVDWEYEAENPLGKRAWARIANRELYSLLDVKSIPTKVVSTDFDKTGQLLDISKNGLAVLLPAQLSDGQRVKIGFFLGKHKVISRAVVRNILTMEGKFRIGMEFVGLDKDSEAYIVSLGSAKGFKDI